MPMPSLLRYFAVVGSALFGLLMFVNYLVQPLDMPAPSAPAPKPVVQHDPQASVIERWRDEQAAIKSADKPQTIPTRVAAAAPEPAPQAAPLPAELLTPPAADPPRIVAPASLTTTPTEVDARAAALKAEKVKAAKLRKARLARERALAQRQQEASRQQDQIYSQSRPAYVQAERPAFAPFGW